MKCLSCLVVVLMLALPVLAQDKALPRVLIIGDNIYSQHCRGLGQDLKDRAQVVFAQWPSEVVANSATVNEHLDALLGHVGRDGELLPADKRPDWDMIHINVGLGDLIYRVPELQSFRVLPIHAGGVVATSPKQYEANLETLMVRLKATGAKLVWAHTTPIRASTSNVFEPGSEVAYNAIAQKVMARHHVPINDMHSYARHLINMDKPASHGADPFDFDKKPIHMPIVRVVEQAFGLKPVVETKEELEVKEALEKPSPEQG